MLGKVLQRYQATHRQREDWRGQRKYDGVQTKVLRGGKNRSRLRMARGVLVVVVVVAVVVVMSIFTGQVKYGV